MPIKPLDAFYGLRCRVRASKMHDWEHEARQLVARHHRGPRSQHRSSGISWSRWRRETSCQPSVAKASASARPDISSRLPADRRIARRQIAGEEAAALNGRIINRRFTMFAVLSGSGISNKGHAYGVPRKSAAP